LNYLELAFGALGVVAVVTAIFALLVRELVHTILWVATFFVALAGLYFLLETPFLGVLQLGVYAGAVTILLLFGVMVTRKRIFSREAATGITAAPLALSVLSFAIVATVASGYAPLEQAVLPISPQAISAQLFGVDSAWLILLALAMLSALAGAIYLVREGRE